MANSSHKFLQLAQAIENLYLCHYPNVFRGFATKTLILLPKPLEFQDAKEERAPSRDACQDGARASTGHDQDAADSR
jgi:hypothetical protein